MRLATLIAWICFSAATAAQDDPLPEDVSNAYIAYERAIEAGDSAAAMAAAETAWRQADAHDIDPELIGVLAANYAELAMARGESESALRAWLAAAAIAERVFPEGAPQRTHRWYMASLSATLAGEGGDARDYAMRAVQNFERDPSRVPAYLRAQSHYVLARSSVEIGRWARIENNALAAIAAFEEAGIDSGRTLADSYYLLGLGRYFWRDPEGSALPFHIASHLFAALGDAHAEETMSTLYWTSLVRWDLDEETLAEIDDDIAESRFPDVLSVSDFRDEADVEFDPDAAPIDREHPDYPDNAAWADVQGIIMVRFDVNERGRTENAEVIAAAPAGIFNEAALDAISRWRYTPARLNGEAVVRPGVLTRFHFNLCTPGERDCNRREHIRDRRARERAEQEDG
ncbi:MAG: energy transducer TonB [Pseudomonadota bacterium]|nr:energy transducer TonB [Pseudomonadota bacterium]